MIEIANKPVRDLSIAWYFNHFDDLNLTNQFKW